MKGQDVSDMDAAAAVIAEVRAALAEDTAAPAPAPVKAPASQKRSLIGYVLKSLDGIAPSGAVVQELAHRGVTTRSVPDCSARVGTWT